MKNTNFFVRFDLNSHYENEVKNIYCPSETFENFDDAFIFLVNEHDKIWNELCDLGVEIEKNTEICFEFSFSNPTSNAIDRIISYDYCLTYEQNGHQLEIKRWSLTYESEFFSFLCGFCSCLQTNNVMAK